MTDLQERIKGQVGVDPMIALAQRQKTSDEISKLREELAPYRAKFRGGTASPYDQRRKQLLSEIAERLRVELTEQGEKVSESKLDSKAHSSEEYKKWLQQQLALMTDMEIMEAKLYGLEQDLEEWDKLIDLARTMIYYTSSEMRLA